MKKTALSYYLSSIKTLLVGIKEWYFIPLLLFVHPLRFTVRNRGVFFADTLMDVWTLKEVLLDDCYKIGSMKKIATVIDIGASIGDFSCLIAGKAKRVVACEADSSRISLLKSNVRGQEKESSVVIIHKKITSLDELIPDKITSCDLLKIDCEGSEYRILLFSKLSTLKKVKQMVGELHFFNKNMKEDFLLLKKQLMQAGFKIKTWDNPVHTSICFFSATR